MLQVSSRGLRFWRGFRKIMSDQLSSGHNETSHQEHVKLTLGYHGILLSSVEH